MRKVGEDDGEQSAETERQIHGSMSWEELVPHHCADLPTTENAVPQADRAEVWVAAGI